MLWTIIVTIVGGVIIGLLGRMAAPGSNKIGLGLTIVCGIVGMIVGSLLYWWAVGHNNGAFDGHAAKWDNATNGVDWWRHIWQIVVAAIAVGLATSLGGGKKSA